jgi:hypothetical protein
VQEPIAGKAGLPGEGLLLADGSGQAAGTACRLLLIVESDRQVEKRVGTMAANGAAAPPRNFMY